MIGPRLRRRYGTNVARCREPARMALRAPPPKSWLRTNHIGLRHARRQRAFQGVNWYAPARAMTAPAVAGSQRELTAAAER